MENSIEMNDDGLSALRKDTIAYSSSERKEKILRAVITWVTRKDGSKNKEGLFEWFLNGNIKEATKYQLHIERWLQQFLPALFESHDDDSTFADEKNRTPLHCCISKMKEDRYYKYPDCELVSALCDLGASIVALDRDGYSPLGIALSKGRMDLVRILMRSGSVNVADRNTLGETVLHILIDKHDYSNGDYKMHHVLVMELLDKGADINQPDQDGVTAVHLAAKKLDIELLQKFKENGADLNCRTNRGDDLLIIACKSLNTWQGNESKGLILIKWLVDYQGFRANVKNSHGFTALHYAAKSENIEIIKRLIGAGADLHAVADDNTNVLHMAATTNNFEVMQHLIEQNVDFRRRDNVYGFSLIHMAAFNKDPRKCEWLVKEQRFDVDDLGKCRLTPLHLASMLGNAKVVEKLIELGADVHRTDDKFHYSALHLASMRGRFVTLRDIIANGEKINDDHSSIVAHWFNYIRINSSNIDYIATLEALVGAGTDVNVRDSFGCTALHYATRDCDSSIIILLLEAGAHVDVQDNERLTPLENSFVNNRYDVSIRLLAFGANIDDMAHLIDEICRKVKNDYFSAGRAIVENLFQWKIAGLPIDERFKGIIDNFESKYLQRQSRYLPELAKMKKRMLTGEVSLYDVLHMSFRRRSTFANSLTRDIEREFSHYFVILKGRCNEAVNRMVLFEPAIEAFERITRMRWPIICIDNIFSFMSNLSMRVLIDAAM